MPRVIVVAGPVGQDAGAAMLSERVSVADLESEHFASRLIERLRWAVADAQDAERVHGQGDAGERVPPGAVSAGCALEAQVQ